MTQYQGLTTKEAARRLVEQGENVLGGKKKVHPLRLFAAQFRDGMTMILLLSTAISMAMGEVVEAMTIVAIVFLNGCLGFLQEWRTERSLEKLSALSAPTATVVRDGRITQLPTSQVVTGDLVLLKAGDRIPADCRLLEESAFCCDESLLSGESVPVEKAAEPFAPGRRGAGEEPCAAQPRATAYMGTLATRGNAKGVVTATGLDTEMGKIAGMLDAIEPDPTPLQQKLDQLGKYIALGCLGICAVVAGVGILRGEPVFDMALTGISLAVAAIPEGLPAIVTIALALSVNRMVRRNAVVRRLHAVETLGCANVICSDKTGTLTENKMTVQQLATADHCFAVTGSGYQSRGQLLLDGKPADPRQSPAVLQALETAVVCSNAQLRPNSGERGKGDQLSVYGEPTEAALAVLGAKLGVTREGSGCRLLKELPFDSERKMMSVAVQRRDGSRVLLTKGGADVVLARCTSCLTQHGVVPMTPALRRKLTSQSEQMAAGALRVLGLCYRPLSAQDGLQEQGLVFAAFAGMQDPPRKEALDAVLRCRRAHIRPVMITGDNRLTACAIARELRIYNEGDQVLTGPELEQMSERELLERLPQVSVFARVSPSHKLRIVQGLKKLGNVVAMTGDGVNDAPAVKEANIGVSMGQNGTDVTKEASSVILMDDNFATLVAAVEEGRVIYRNIRKFIRYLLSCNIGEVVTMFLAMLMGMPVPLLPIQILLVNLVTDGLPAIALGLDPPDRDVMTQRPRRPEESVFSGGLLTVIWFRGMLIGLTTVGVFSLFLKAGASLELCRTAALVTLVLTQLIHVFECKSEERSLFGIPLFNNWKLIGAVAVSAAVLAAAVYHPVMRVIFRTVPLTGQQLGLVCVSLLVAPLLWAAVTHLRLGRRREETAGEKAEPSAAQGRAARQA